MVFSQTDILGLFVFAVMAYLPLRSITNMTPWWYVVAKYGQKSPNTKRRGIVCGLPPSWAFGLIWSIEYGLVAVSSFLFWLQSFAVVSDSLWTWWWAVYLVLIASLKTWPIIFYEMEGGIGAITGFFWIIVSLASSITLLFFYANAGNWWAFGLLIALPIWLLYALWLNGQFVMYRRLIYGRDTGYAQYLAMEHNGLNIKRLDVRHLEHIGDDGQFHQL